MDGNRDVKVLNFCRSVSRPSVFVTLYQAFPKADKMDAVVQKSVELGVSRIVPMLSERCVSRPDEKAVKRKPTAGKRSPRKRPSKAGAA
ncbi:MAG: RsmE family RNA methyltransferase [Anaeromassilibacillus sp.]